MEYIKTKISSNKLKPQKEKVYRVSMIALRQLEKLEHDLLKLMLKQQNILKFSILNLFEEGMESAKLHSTLSTL